jgi:hypothetical protein
MKYLQCWDERWVEMTADEMAGMWVEQKESVMVVQWVDL